LVYGKKSFNLSSTISNPVEVLVTSAIHSLKKTLRFFGTCTNRLHANYFMVSQSKLIYRLQKYIYLDCLRSNYNI